jgi:hypothetical protein
LGYWR